MSVVPVLVNSHGGLTKIDPAVVDLVRILTASWWQTPLTIRLSPALPAAFDGMKIAMSPAVVGAFVGGFTSAEQGLGNRILLTSSQLDISLMCGAIPAVPLVAVGLVGVLRLLDRLLAPWAAEVRES